MSIDILRGAAAAEAGSDSEFAGTLNPRGFHISESLMDYAHTLMSEAVAGRFGANVRLAAAFGGRMGPGSRLSEAFSSSDFTLAAFAAIDTEMQAQYAELPAVWRQYTTVTTVNDFRPKRLLDKWRNTIGFEPVPELTEYPAEDQRGHAVNEIAVSKMGRRFALSWEAFINNEAINELEDLPGVLARQARESETINAVSNLVAANRNGVNTDYFKSANGNAPTALPLTLDNLDTVLGQMATRPDANSGRQIASPPLLVVVPRALERAIQRILAIRTIRHTDGADELEYDNYVNVDYVVEPMLDYWNTGAKSATTWYVLPKPATAVRPAVWAAFLRGHETPDLRVKASTGTTVGGGQISPLEGSFELDDIQYRGRHVLGNQVGDPTFTYVSNGA